MKHYAWISQQNYRESRRIEENKVAYISDDDIKNEIWLKIKEYNNHIISNYGRVAEFNYSINKYKLYKFEPYKLQLHTNNYVSFGIPVEGPHIKNKNVNTLYIDIRSFSLHRVVLQTFSAMTEEDIELNRIYVNHMDWNPSNNKLSNLEWVNASENRCHGHIKDRYKAMSGRGMKALKLIKSKN